MGLTETYLQRYFNRSLYTKAIYGSIILSLLFGVGMAVKVKLKFDSKMAYPQRNLLNLHNPSVENLQKVVPQNLHNIVDIVPFNM